MFRSQLLDERIAPAIAGAKLDVVGLASAMETPARSTCAATATCPSR